MARYALPVIGGVVGFFIGGPAGAAWGWQIGSLAGSIVDPQTIKGPGVGDIAQQTSQAGVPRPIVFGRSQPIAGNVIASGEPVIVKKKQSAGKGGPKVETESVYRTYAIRVCEGPIDGFLRVWRNNVLVYDARPGGDLSAEENAKFLNNARFFLGDYDQNPSPDLETIFGVGTTPAHRGTCYMVMANEDLTDLRGAIPQFQFQVTKGARIPTVAQGVLWPWLSGAVTDPRHPLGLYTYGTNDTGGFRAEAGGTDKCAGVGASIVGAAGFDSLSAAIAALNAEWGSGRFESTPFAYSSSASFNLTHNFTVPPTSESSEDKPQASSYQRWVWLHHAITGLGPSRIMGSVTEEEAMLDPDVADGTRFWYTPFSAALWTDWPNAFVVRKNIATQDSTWQFGVQYITGGIGPDCSTPNHSAYVPASVRVELQPGPPNENADRITGTFRALRTFIDAGGTANGNPQRFPVGPVIEASDPRYDDQDFWEQAYADALAAGTPNVSAGWTYGNQYPNDQDWAFFYYDTVNADSIPVTDIIDQICERIGLTQYDASELEDLLCHGLTITNQYPVYTAFQALGQVFMFDGANIDGQLRFVRRGADSVATVLSGDFVDDQDMDFELSTRQDSIGVPRVMHLNYYDIDGGLATDKQSSERPGDRRSVGEQSLSNAVMMDADQAAQVVAIQHKVGVEELRGEKKFSLSDKFIRLTSTNPILVEWDTVLRRLRITSAEVMDGYQQYTAVHDRQSNYTSDVEGIPAAPQTPPPSGVVGPTMLVPLDIHILRDADDTPGLIGYIAVAGAFPAWQGARIEVSYDGGANYVDAIDVTTAAVMGNLTTELPDHPQAYPDETNSFGVSMYDDESELEATDLTGMLNGQNLAIVEDEMIQFAEPDETSQGQWEISYLLRGRKGTETAHHPIGSRFVVLDRNVLGVVGANLTDVGRTLTFRATSFGTTTDTATVATVTYQGMSQKERQPAYLQAYRSGADVVASWQGVGRLGSGAQVAHGQRFDGYRVTFSDGVDEIQVETFDQELTQDVSTLSGPVTITVEQLNSLTGAGPSIEVTVA